VAITVAAVTVVIASTVTGNNKKSSLSGRRHTVF